MKELTDKSSVFPPVTILLLPQMDTLASYGWTLLTDLAAAWQKKKAGSARRRDQQEWEQIWRSLKKEESHFGPTIPEAAIL